MVHLGGNENNGVGNALRIPMKGHREEGAENHKWNVGNTGGWIGVEGVWDAYISHIHSPHSGDGVAVGVSVSNLISLCTGSGVQESRAE